MANSPKFINLTGRKVLGLTYHNKTSATILEVINYLIIKWALL